MPSAAFVPLFSSPSLPVRFWSIPRVREPELMDDPALAEADHLRALVALGRINTLSLTTARLAAGVVALADGQEERGAGLEVIDVASGGGDVTIDLARRLRGAARWQAVAITGIDISPRAIERARDLAARLGSPATFLLRDVTAQGCPPCDVAVSSLFLHHLDDDDARQLLRVMASAARRGIVISDLIRSPAGLFLAHVATLFLTGSRVARVDGPRSVRAARTPAEYRALLESVGLRGATVRRVWPERVVIVWRALGEDR
jgi:2-polyprenyl-3-methyl-5-hydroxy-6-metoxy-1,4-benzoquinol methylase